MKQSKRKQLALLLAVLLLAAMALPCLAVSGPRGKTVRVGFYEMAGYEDVGEDGTPSGYAYDYVQALSQYNAWQIEFVTGYDWSECMTLLENGEIDLLCGVLKTEEREKIFDYPDLCSGVGYSCLTVSGENTAVGFDDFESFQNMTVGLAKNSARNAGFFEYCDKNHLSVDSVIFDTEIEMTNALDAGEIDAMLTTSNLKSDGCRVVAKFDPQSQYIVTTKGNASILEELNNALNRLKTDVPSFDDKLFEKHYGSSRGETAVFSKEEQAYIAEHPTAKVLYDPSWAPIEAYDAQTQGAHGVSVDILEKVSESCGIQFEYITAEDFEAALSRFEKGDAEIFSAITYDYHWASQNGMYLTQPYMDIPLVTIYKSEVAKNRRLALPVGYYITQLMESKAEDARIVYYPTVEACMDAVNEGEADYTFANSYEADYYLSMAKYHGLNFRSLQSVSQQLSIAIAQTADPRLHSILSKAIQSVSQSDITAAIRTHTEHPHTSTLLDMMYTNPAQFLTIIVAIVGLVFTVCILFFFYFTNRKKNLALQHALAAKSDFLSNMSHDMRTPMNGILGLVQLTRDLPDLPEEVAANLSVVDDSSKYLLRLINDTLDMSKIESNKLSLNPQVVDSNTLIRNIVAYVMPSAKEKGVELTVIPINAQLEYIRTDPLRLQQVFVNIISNAIKFTPAGGKIEMVIECLKRENGIAYDRIVVRDSGIGMSEEFLPKIFEPFEQEAEGAQNRTSGTGLGMSIVKKLIEMMGGTIEIKSKKGVGTEVIVYLRFERVYEYTPPKTQGSGNVAILKNCRILLCEDHPVNAQIATKLLEKQHILVEHAADGKQAVERFSAGAEGTYDAILMDIRMPVMDGLEATRAIRALDRADAAIIPIVAMTANAFDEDVEKSREAGMNAHLGKPVEADLLYQTLAEEIGKARGC